MEHRADDHAARLNQIATSLLRSARSPAREAGLSSAQYSAMGAIYHEPGIGLVELAAREAVRHPTMSRLVAGLVKRDLVRREADAADQRASRLSLTAEGERLYLEASERRIALFRMVLGQLSPSARDEVIAVAETMARIVARPAD